MLAAPPSSSTRRPGQEASSLRSAASVTRAWVLRLSTSWASRGLSARHSRPSSVMVDLKISYVHYSCLNSHFYTIPDL